MGASVFCVGPVFCFCLFLVFDFSVIFVAFVNCGNFLRCLLHLISHSVLLLVRLLKFC